MRKCRFCAASIDDAATVCPQCHQDLFPGRASAGDVPHTPAIAPPVSPPELGSLSVVVVGLLVAVSLVGAAIGTLFLSQATTGVGLLCGACFLGILARLVQSGAQHRALMASLVLTSSAR